MGGSTVPSSRRENERLALVFAGQLAYPGVVVVRRTPTLQRLELRIAFSKKRKPTTDKLRVP